jgi:hypothetical protein
LQRDDLVVELRCSMGDWFRVATMPGSWGVVAHVTSLIIAQARVTPC